MDEKTNGKGRGREEQEERNGTRNRVKRRTGRNNILETSSQPLFNSLSTISVILRLLARVFRPEERILTTGIFLCSYFTGSCAIKNTGSRGMASHLESSTSPTSSSRSPFLSLSLSSFTSLLLRVCLCVCTLSTLLIRFQRLFWSFSDVQFISECIKTQHQKVTAFFPLCVQTKFCANFFTRNKKT